MKAKTNSLTLIDDLQTLKNIYYRLYAPTDLERIEFHAIVSKLGTLTESTSRTGGDLSASIQKYQFFCNCRERYHLMGAASLSSHARQLAKEIDIEFRQLLEHTISELQQQPFDPQAIIKEFTPVPENVVSIGGA